MPLLPVTCSNWAKKIPDITNNLGKQFLSFSNYQFEIVNSDIRNKNMHQVAINFYSEPLLWHDAIDNYLLVSAADAVPSVDGIATNLVSIQLFLNIYSLKQETV